MIFRSRIIWTSAISRNFGYEKRRQKSLAPGSLCMPAMVLLSNGRLRSFMLDFHRTRHGYKEIFTPFMVARESAFGTGQLPKLEEDMYRTDVDDFISDSDR
jgi:seryl-tRNA synthetase